MSTNRFRIPCLAVAAALLSSMMSPGARGAPPSGEPTVRTSFAQLDWLGPQGQTLVECSPIFEAEFRPHRHDTVFLGDEGGSGGAWINVVAWLPDSPEPEVWAVQNLRLAYPDVTFMAGSTPGVQFGLPIEPGTCLATLEHAVFVTPMPLPGPPAVTDWESARVRDEDYLAGGRVALDGSSWGGTGYADIPWFPDPWGSWPPWPPGPPPPPPPLPIATRWAPKPVKGVEAVAELIDGCAPAAATRSIKSLMDGEKTDSTTQMYNDLINEMGTTVGGQPNGGTTDAGLESGKDSYANDENLPIDTSTSYGAGSFGQALNTLGPGGDVEVLIGWSGGGGHVAMVTGMTQNADGSWDVTYVDDPDQSDGRAENAEHVIHVDAAGNFDGGHVDGFVLETHQ